MRDSLSSEPRRNIDKERRTKLRQARRNAIAGHITVAGAIAYICIGLALLASGRLWYEEIGRSGHILTLLYAFGLFGAFFAVFCYRLVRLRPGSSSLVRLGYENAPELWKVLESLSQKAEVDLRKVRLWLALGNSGFTASVEGSAEPDVVVSMQLLRESRTSPEVAEGVLAHELGHVEHRDTLLWRVVRAFSDATLRVYLPVTVIASVIALVMAMVNIRNGIVDARNQRVEGVDNIVAATREQVIDERENVLDVLNQSQSVRYPYYRFSETSPVLSPYDLSERLSQEFNSEQEAKEWFLSRLEKLDAASQNWKREESFFQSEDFAFFLVFVALLVGFGIGLPWLFLRAALNARFQSEYLADLAAARLTGKDTIIKALKRTTATERRWFSHHPPSEQRIKAIASLPD